MMTTSDLGERFWQGLVDEGLELGDLFGGREILLDDPRAGRVAGAAAAGGYVAETHAWLAGQAARYTPLATTRGAERLVHEGILNLILPSRAAIDLPVALAADLAGQRVTWLRIYYSLWPVQGHHNLRNPLLPARHDLAVPDVVGRYQAALAGGDLEAILACFAEDGCAREPSGGPYLHCGPQGLREFYGLLFANAGGITLEHCTLTDDGVRCSLEYNAIAWGRTPLPPQAGIAVYERGRTGRLSAARIYDDVDPPVA